VYSLRLLNSPTYYLFISISVYVYRPSLHIHASPLFQVELEKRRLGVDGHAYCFGVRVPRTLDYPTINLNLR